MDAVRRRVLPEDGEGRASASECADTAALGPSGKLPIQHVFLSPAGSSLPLLCQSNFDSVLHLDISRPAFITAITIDEALASIRIPTGRAGDLQWCALVSIVETILISLNDTIKTIDPKILQHVCIDGKRYLRTVQKGTVRERAILFTRFLLCMMRASEGPVHQGLDGPACRDLRRCVDKLREVVADVGSKPSPRELERVKAVLFDVASEVLVQRGTLAEHRNPVFRWWVAMLLNRNPLNGSIFASPGQGTSTIAAFCWVLQVMKAFIIQDELPDDTPQHVYASCIARHTEGFGHKATSLLGPISARWAHIKNVGQEQINLRCLWVGDTVKMPQNGRLYQFSVDQLQQTVGKVLKDLTGLLHDDLFMGQRAEFDNIVLDDVFDDWTCKTDGHSSFLALQDADEGGKKGQSRRLALWRAAMTPASPLGKRLFLIDRGQGMLNVAEARMYLAKAQAFNRLNLLLTQLTSGLPARSGTMLASTLVETRYGRRGVFVFHGTIMLASGYDKADKLKHVARPSVRFLMAQHASLLAEYLTYVRPFEE